MTCPRCGNRPLVIAIRDGVVIDRCPRCRGVWLDAGELDRLQAHAWSAALDDAEPVVLIESVTSR